MSAVRRSLEGEVALVTGAGRRLGRAIAQALAAEGARLVLHHHSSAAEAGSLASEIAAAGGDAALVAADLRDPGAVRAMVRQAFSRFGRLDHLVNNASAFYPTPLGTTTDAQWDELVGVNLRAPFVASEEASRLLAEGGSIVNLTDTSTATPWTDHVVYQTAKAGLEAMTRYLARALAPRVRVNAVAPGPILMPPDASAAELERALRRVPLGRLGEPADVARAVVFLATSRYLTGVVIPVDGGRRVG